MTVSQITELMAEHIEDISKMLEVPSTTVQAWIDDPVLILDLGVVEANRLSYCIGIDLISFIDTFEKELPAEAWE